MSDIFKNVDATANTVTFEESSTKADLWMRSTYGDRIIRFHLPDDLQAVNDFETAAKQKNFSVTTFP